MRNFKDFLNKKVRKGKKQLAVVKKVLEEQGMSVQDHLGNDDPYLFVKNPTSKKTSFAGVRIYKIGENIAYRVQKEEKTHPYGVAYSLDLEGAFEDFLSDMKEEEAVKEVIKAVGIELKAFFEKSSEAEQTIKRVQISKADPIKTTSVKDLGTDYGATIFTSM